MSPAIDTGDTAWMLASTALVLLMTIGLGIFYAGLVRAKSSLNTFMMCVSAMAIGGISWALLGYSLAFDGEGALIGGLGHVALSGVGFEPRGEGTIPHLVFMAFQGTFCIITVALISGAVVERMRFGAFMVFAALWSVLVYAVLAHWAFGGGWLAQQGTLDFAGGVPVEMASGFSALAAALVVGARKDYGRQALLPHNAMYVLLGAGLLWFGWFGFNAGSALAAGELAGLAFTTTFLAPMGTLVVWTILDYMRLGKPTAVGAATGIVIGLVAITPAAGFIGPMSAIALGPIAAVPSYFGLIFRAKTQLDDSLDVVAAHGVGGTVGALLTGVFAQKALNSAGNDGLLFGNPGQLGVQAMAVVAAMVYSGAVSFILLKIIGAVVPLRATAADESVGLDLSVHGEEAYVQPGSGAASAH
jgi:Amt family ammonium transporter